MDGIQPWIVAITSSEWVYFAIFVLAVAEASVITSFFLSGTVAFVVVGVLLQQGLLNPVPAVLSIYGGTLAGDISTYFLAGRLRKFRFVEAALVKASTLCQPMRDAPFRFIVAGHVTPYVRALLPVVAAGTLVPARYLRIEAFAAMVSTLTFLGIGYFGAHLVRAVSPEQALLLVGAIAAGVIALTWFRSSRFAVAAVRNRGARGGIARTAFFLAWFPFWHPIRWIENQLRGLPTRQLRRALAAAFPDIEPGDVLLIRLHASAPWGRWAHSAIATTEGQFVHGFGKVITGHAISSLPVRYAIAHLRPACVPPLALQAAAVAKGQIGAKVSILARRGETGRFSCASLIAFAYREVGVDLVDHAIDRITPDDLFVSSALTLVRIIHTEQVSRSTRRYIFEKRQRGDHG